MIILDINNSTIMVALLLMVVLIAFIGLAIYGVSRYIGILTAGTSRQKKLLYFFLCLAVACVLISLRYCLTGKGLIE